MCCVRGWWTLRACEPRFDDAVVDMSSPGQRDVAIRPEHVARACIAMCSGLMDSVTGQVITVDEGASLVSPATYATGLRLARPVSDRRGRDMLTIESGAAALFERACREPLIERDERERGPALDEAAIRALLPHRPPFVFVDRVTRLDTANGVIVGRYDIQRDSSLLAGHFPGSSGMAGRAAD